MDLTFVWDPKKARANIEKHTVNFAEAMEVFSDPLARIIGDEDHSVDERREIIIGHSQSKRLLMVCFTEPEQGRIRIISARRATRIERQDYEEYLRY